MKRFWCLEEAMPSSASRERASDSSARKRLSVSEIFLRLCTPFLGRQMELDEFKITMDLILQQFLDQLPKLERGHYYSDLRRFAESLMRDLDLWNHVIVKSKLGILKSKIKKVDYIYHDMLPDGRLDPSESESTPKVWGQKVEEKKKANSVKFLSLPKMKRSRPHEIMVTMTLDKISKSSVRLNWRYLLSIELFTSPLSTAKSAKTAF